MTRAVLVILAAALVAFIARRAIHAIRLPRYQSWAEDAGDDREGEALPADVYLVALMAAQGK